MKPHVHPRSSELTQNHDNVSEWSHMSTRGAVSWLRIMIMCQSKATCLPPRSSELAQNHDNVSEWNHISTRGAVSWLRIMIMCRSKTTCLPAEQCAGLESWYCVRVKPHVHPRSSELAQNHDNVSEWSYMSTRGAWSWLWIMIMCQSEATCLPVGQWSGSESW